MNGEDGKKEEKTFDKFPFPFCQFLKDSRDIFHASLVSDNISYREMLKIL
jgi:hypothetical protein